MLSPTVVPPEADAVERAVVFVLAVIVLPAKSNNALINQVMFAVVVTLADREVPDAVVFVLLASTVALELAPA